MFLKLVATKVTLVPIYNNNRIVRARPKPGKAVKAVKAQGPLRLTPKKKKSTCYVQREDIIDGYNRISHLK